jgi:hypothetical protein
MTTIPSTSQQDIGGKINGINQESLENIKLDETVEPLRVFQAQIEVPTF